MEFNFTPQNTRILMLSHHRKCLFIDCTLEYEVNLNLEKFFLYTYERYQIVGSEVAYNWSAFQVDDHYL